MRLTKRDLLKAKNGAILQFSGEDNEIGNIVFNNNLALSSSSPVTMSMQQTFNIDGADAYFSNNINTSGSLSVDGATALANTLTVTQGSTLQGTLDVTGESIFATNTTVSGTLKAEGDLDFSASGGNLKAGTINALTVNSAGEVTKIGQDTPGGGQFLKWDGNKVVWDNASVNALSLDAITAATGSETRVQTSGDLHLDSTGGEIFLSSSDDFNFLSDDSAAAINFYNTGVTTAGLGQISLSVVDRGNNKNFSSLTFNGLNIRDRNNEPSNQQISGLGTNGAEILNNNNLDNQYSPMIIGTKNMNTSDSYGQNVTGSLVFAANDRRFIFCDTGRLQTSAGHPYPFFHIKKQRASLTDLNLNFEVEFNATKGTGGSWLKNFYNTTFVTHSTFLKSNQDGQITKLGHDTPTDGQVLTWDNTNGYVVWSDTSSVYSTLDSLTNTTISSPNDREVLKYNGTNWVNASPYPPSSRIGLGSSTNNYSITETQVLNHSYVTYQASTFTLTLPDPQVSGKLTSSDFIYIQLKPGTTLYLKATSDGTSTATHIYNYPSGYATNGNSITFDNIKYTKVIKVSLQGSSSSNLIYYVNSNLLNLGQTQDVEIGATGNALADGHVLKYNNNNQKWENKPSGAQTLSDLTDTDLTTTAPTEGDYLKYVSGKWVPVTAPVSTPTYLSTTNSPITATINYHYSINTSVRPVVIDLPQAHTSNRGKRIIIKFKTGNNLLTVKPASGQTIENDGNPFEMTPNQTPGQSITLVSNGGNNWEII